MLSLSERERGLSDGYRLVEGVFSSLDAMGLLSRPYRKTKGLVFHVYSALLAHGLFKLLEAYPRLGLLLG